jgi:hypothetical protein
MSNVILDRYGLNFPNLYRVDVVRDATRSYVANLDDKNIFIGYHINNPDILLSKFLAMTKALLLQDDPNIIRNGNGHIEVYFVDGIRCEQLLVYDSSQSYKGNRGISRQIIDNLEKEIDILWGFIDKPGIHITLVEDEGEKHQYLSTGYDVDDVDPILLKPMSEEAWHFNHSDLEITLGILKMQKEEEKSGVYSMYGTYRTVQVESKDAA